VSLRLVTFDAARTHPAHVQQLVHSHLTVLHLTHIIRAETSVAASRILVYADRPPDAEPLPEDRSLVLRRILTCTMSICLFAGVVICLGRDADLHMAQLMPLSLTVSCSRKSRLILFLPFWYWLTQVVTDKMQRAVKR